MNQHLVLGILAHVDAGKTTLSEGILYLTGTIRKAGRVDHGDAFLDTFELEKKRGITIFSKQAKFSIGEKDFTLLDTPGHVDFSPEMERTLQVLDYAVLVVSAQEGVNGHVKMLWKLLEHYHLPVFVFVNKMDQPGADLDHILEEIHHSLSDAAMDFCRDLTEEEQQENLAVTDEKLMEEYLKGKQIARGQIVRLIRERKVFPVFHGSALRMEGIQELLDGMETYMTPAETSDQFGARVFKISRDPQGARLTWLRLTGGTLKVKTLLGGEDGQGEKIDQIRIYSGSGYELVQEAVCGEVCAVTGPAKTKIGEGFGTERNQEQEFLQPVLRCAVLLPPDADRTEALRDLRALEEEEPMLHISCREETGEIFAGIMGQVQTEILRQLLKDRFHLDVTFGPGSIVYKETIANTVEGVGHFEPLRHYAEVHLLLEPGDAGSGLVLDTDCSTDELALNWQRLIMTHLEEKTYRGVLTGSEITDMKITLIGGRAHEKHTEGGDFRQATYRAVRQGLMMADNILLEPVYEYQIELPSENIGRAMSDMERMGGTMNPPENDGLQAVITGTVPASELKDYQTELTAYTKGQGHLSFRLKEYRPCHNAEEVIEAKHYIPELDTQDPSSSVFCSHGVGTIIPWDSVRNYMHVDTGWKPGLIRGADGWVPADPKEGSGYASQEDSVAMTASELAEKRKEKPKSFRERERERGAAEAELKEIFERTYGKGKNRGLSDSGTLDRMSADEDVYDQSWRDYRSGRDAGRKKGVSGENSGYRAAEAMREKNRNSGSKKEEKQREYLLVDGYNIIFAWEKLQDLSLENIDAARDALMDILSDYQGYCGKEIILVFDAYKVSGGTGEVYRYHNISVVYTKEAETADAYIEKTVHDLGRKHHVTVATSDGAEQVIILGEGAVRMSARELYENILQARQEIRTDYIRRTNHGFHYLFDQADSGTKQELHRMRHGKK